MKKLLYSCIAFCTLVLAGCADQDVAEINATNNDGPGVKVSMTMEGEMQSDAAAATPNSRAIGYEVKDNGGFPTAKGLYDGVGASAHELTTGTKVPVILIFKSDNASQPVTKVKTMWTYTQGGKLTLKSSETFEMESGTDLSQGTWYVCGILGGELDNTNSNVKFDGFVGDYTPTTSGSKTTFGAEIPYIFGWRKLETNAAKKTFKAEKEVKFKQFGSIVRLKVTNKTGFNFMYNGVRIITSNILCGQFDLKSFDDVATSDLKDTQDGEIASAKSASYKNAFKAFKFYQRPLTDAAMTGNDGLINKKGFRIHGDYIANYAEEKAGTKLNTALYYYDHIFLKKQSGDNFDNVPNGQEAPSYIYVWMAPQQQAIKIYNGDEEGTGGYDLKKVSKTQFLLMAVPTETSVGNKIVPTSINMLPAYGTLHAYESGANYPAKGEVLYKFAPLSYIAKHDNFGNEAELSSTANQDIAHTTRYLYSEIETKLSTIPSNYMFADHEYWRSIIPQFFGFPAFRKDGSGNLRYTNYSFGFVSPAKLPGWSESLLVFHSYAKAVADNGISYMIGMSKRPDYINDGSEGCVYRGYAKSYYAAAKKVTSGLNVTKWVGNNDYRYTIRWEDKNGAAVLTQRYLGPRFVLDIDDISNEDFWAAPKNYDVTYPADVTRVFPYAGINASAATLDPNRPADKPNQGQTWWYFDYNSIGKGTQYWTPNDALTGARYNVGGGKGYMEDYLHQAPKQSVSFKGQSDQENVSGFMNYYLYVNSPDKQQNDPQYGADSRYVKGYKSAAPVRLWRKKTPYAD